VTRSRGRRRRKLLDELKDKRGYCRLKEEALDRTMWRTRFGRALDLSSDRILNDEMKVNVRYTGLTRNIFSLYAFTINYLLLTETQI
jgi:hypothetical protein